MFEISIVTKRHAGHRAKFIQSHFRNFVCALFDISVREFCVYARLLLNRYTRSMSTVLRAECIVVGMYEYTL